MGVEEIVKILVVVVVLVILIGAFVFLFKIGGGKILDLVRNTLRFGG